MLPPCPRLRRSGWLQITFPHIEIHHTVRFCRCAPDLASVEADSVQGLRWGFGTGWHSVLEVINTVVTLHDAAFAAYIAGQPRMPGRMQVAGPDHRTDRELRLERHITTRGFEDALELCPDTPHILWVFAARDGRLRVVTVEGDTRFQFGFGEHPGINQALNT